MRKNNKNLNTMIFYNEYVKNKGIPMSVMNPGSNEIALNVEDALWAILLLRRALIPILGGDIVTKDKNGELSYAFHDWGEYYIYLNFYCNIESNESNELYVNRSHDIAKRGILEADKVAKQLGKECYIVLIV